MKTPGRWNPSRVMPSLSVFLPERPPNTHTSHSCLYVNRFSCESAEWWTYRHTRADGTDFRPSTADAGGINRMLIVRNSALFGANRMLIVRNSALFGAPFSTNMIMKKKKQLSSTKESRFSKLLSKRAILALFFFSVQGATRTSQYNSNRWALIVVTM